MRRGGGIVMVALLGICLTDLALANAPRTSLRPVTREHVFPPALPSFAPDRSLRPKPRPERRERAVVMVAAPKPRATAPERPEPAAQPAAMAGRDAAEAGIQTRNTRRSDGLVRLCRDSDLVGKEIAPIPAKLEGCGIPSGAIKLYEVNGVRLSTPATLNCSTAKALSKWVGEDMEPAVRRYGGGVVELKVAASYACRTRNNRKGAKISEHGRGNAIDLSEFRLKNGDVISVQDHWGRGRKGRILKKMHRGACGPFGTVLGPRADRYHQDHFHFDVARHRGGPYCR